MKVLPASPEPEETVIPTPSPDYALQEEQVTSKEAEVQGRSYESFRDFPYENMDFVDVETFEFLKGIYKSIDFYGEFEMGDFSLYDQYIEEYRKLVDNEVTFTVPETEEEFYLKEYGPLKIGGSEIDPHEYVYYLFDMNGDGTPELCIWNYATLFYGRINLEQWKGNIFGNNTCLCR